MRCIDCKFCVQDFDGQYYSCHRKCPSKVDERAYCISYVDSIWVYPHGFPYIQFPNRDWCGEFQRLIFRETIESRRYDVLFDGVSEKVSFL